MGGIVRKKGKKRAVHGNGRRRSKRWLWWLFAVPLFVFLAYFFHRPLIAWIGAVSRAAGQSAIQEEQRRGTIYDRNFAELAVSRQMVSVQSRARGINSFEETAARLSLVLDQSREELLKKMREASRAILAKGISREQEEQIAAMDIPGISIVHAPVRSYPEEVVAGHIIGYAENEVGISGAEYAYDRVPLQFASHLKKSGIPPGRLPDLMLTLDLKIQELMENLVKTISGGNRRTRVGAYVLDLDQGQMLAAVQWPSMNPNMYKQYEPDDLNSIITQTMPLPGKFRLFLQGVARLQHSFEDGKTILPWSISAENGKHASELLLWNNLQFSGPVRADFANQELFAHDGEERYLYPSLAGHDYGSVPEALSPLQLLTGIGILAKGGASLRPFALAAALNPDDRDKEKRVLVELTDDSHVPREAVPEVVAKEALRLFASMALPGAGGAPIFYDYRDCQKIGGKAGFARHQLYAVAMPEKRPEYVLLVSVRKVGSGVPARDEREKADDMAEINALLERVLMFVEVGRGLRGYAAAHSDSSGAYSTNRDSLRRHILIGGDQQEAPAIAKDWLMPDMAGMSLRRGLRLLNGAPCRLEITGSGDVLRQTPAAGAAIKADTVCQLVLRNPADITIEKIKKRNLAENVAAVSPVKARGAREVERLRQQIKAEGRKLP
ncbi:MAG TPA: hypothetical protein DEB25_00445 [Desulfobulbaceae bacterium]|nr:hypothetical protein [Desulfobulbaceae bacterium]